MKNLPRKQANLAWGKLWDDLKSEWFKVEVLQEYLAEDEGESLNAWMVGNRERSMELLRSEPHDWADDCRAKVQAGIKLIRIHIVDYPLSEYMQWELEVYKNRNIPIGNEEVYLVNRKDIPNIRLPDGDLMMFDRTNVVVGNYDESGYAVTQDFYGQTDNISHFLDLRETLLNANLQRVVP